MDDSNGGGNEASGSGIESRNYSTSKIKDNNEAEKKAPRPSILQRKRKMNMEKLETAEISNNEQEVEENFRLLEVRIKKKLKFFLGFLWCSFLVFILLTFYPHPISIIV